MSVAAKRLFFFSLKQNSYHKKPANILNRERCFLKLSLRNFNRRAVEKNTPGKDSLNTVESTSRLRYLTKPFLFTVLFSGTTFVGCSLWQYEHIRHKIRTKGQKHGFIGKAGSFRNHINVYWNKLSEGQKAVVAMIGLNTTVFLLWRIPALTGFMTRYFTSSPFSGAVCSSMLLSSFSHKLILHLYVNMYVLWSFAPPITEMLGREQFIAMYLSAAVISSFTSYMYRVARMNPIGSVGASGAIMAVLGAVCAFQPDSQLSIVLVDQLFPHSFSAKHGVIAIVSLDVLGCLLGWRLFDHAAHLGGMLFGIWYATYGYNLIWKNREPWLMKWHKMRQKAGRSEK